MYQSLRQSVDYRPVNSLVFCTQLIIFILAIFSVVEASTIHVPVDQPTIQAGIDAAMTGDTVLVAPGLYQGDGNRYIRFLGKGVTLIGEGGPDSCQMYCESRHRAFSFVDGEDSSAVVKGFRITGEFGDGDYNIDKGGAVLCENSSPVYINCVFEGHWAEYAGGAVHIVNGSPRFRSCIIRKNTAEPSVGLIMAYGGAVSCYGGSTPVFENSVFAGNYARGGGGAIACVDSDPTFINCTMADNSAYYGSHVYCSLSAPTAQACILGFSRSGKAVYCADEQSDPLFSCCNFYGNAYGDWEGCTSQSDMNGNTAYNPMHCDLGRGDYHLLSTSPCLAANHDCGLLVGAFGEGCNPEYRVWEVEADGRGDAPTVQAAIDSAVHGDTVLLHPGVFTGEGNRGLDLGGKLITLTGLDGPEMTVIDCESEDRGFDLHFAEDSSATISRLTVRNGRGRGAGARCWNSSPRFSECWFLNNDATHYHFGFSFGGGVHLLRSSAKLERCLIAHNKCGTGNSTNNGGGLYIGRSNAELTNCTIIGNQATNGGAISVSRSSLLVSKCIIADNYTFGLRPALDCYRSDVQIVCSDVFNNANGDWIECLEGLEGEDGNFSADPNFCLSDSMDFHIHATSPCAATNNDCGTLIGALDIGCPPPTILTPNPVYTYWSHALFNQPGTTYVGNIPSTGTVSDIDISSVAINGAITPQSCSVIDSHPQFIGDVLVVEFTINHLPESYGPAWGTTVQTYSIAGAFTDGSPWEFTGEFSLIGHKAGDLNLDGTVDIADLVIMIEFMFHSGPMPESNSADLDANGQIDVADLILLVEEIFIQ